MISDNSPNNRTVSDSTITGVWPLRTRWLGTTVFCAFGLAFLLILTAGCGPSERQRVQTVSDQFLDALAQRDWSRAKPLLTEKGRDAMGSSNPFSEDTNGDKEKNSLTPGLEAYTLSEPKIEDLLASVPVTLTSEGHTDSGTLRLRREDGEWRVRALRVEGANDTPGITLDFENPEAALLGAAFRAVGEGVGQVLKGLGQGMGAFLEGARKGADAMRKPEGAESPEATESPKPSPGSESSVRIEEHANGG